MTVSLLHGLNPEQSAAVTLADESALILAGAGSGKTRVLTTRMAWLLQNGRAAPHQLLAVTFTNKASREMLARLGAMLPLDTRGMWVGTFHGLCHRLLRAHVREARLEPTFQIMDSQEQQSALKRLMRAQNVDEGNYPPRQVQQFINHHKEQGRRPAVVNPPDRQGRALLQLYQDYEAQCQREGTVDFAELLLRSVELLNQDQNLRIHYQERFTHLLVDEFQDTNRLQYQWLKLLSGTNSTVFAVGDDDQSIYGFRGADVRNMRSFEQDFKIRRVVRLERNYRSHGNILSAANALICNNQGRLGKELWTEAGAGEPLQVIEAPDDASEARAVVAGVRQHLDAGVPLSDMAVLYRSNAQSRILEQVLFTAGISYRVYGGLRFFERQEVRHGLAYLRLAANPGDEGAFLRVVNFPPRGIGARSLELLQQFARERGCTLLAAAVAPAALGTRAQASLSGFAGLIEQLGKAASSEPLPSLIELMLERSGLRAHYQQEREGADRVANLEELVAAAHEFVQEHGAQGGLSGFLAHASLESGEHEAIPGADALQLMTVHAAKGLEFRCVWVCGLEEGLFPHENASHTDQELEEERRLMYVAITRAREHLYLTLAGSRMLHGQIRFGVRSRFIDEIPRELCQWQRVEKPGAVVRGLQRAQYESYSGRPQFSSAGAVHSPVNSHFGAASSPFRIGQAVRHERFGAGVVLQCEGAGTDSRIQVNFRDVGTKWLALAFARLVAA